MPMLPSFHPVRKSVLGLRAILLAGLSLLGAATLTAAQDPVVGGASPPAGNPRGAHRDREFLPDANFRGEARELHLLALRWGRLVDVHAIDALGDVDPIPVFEDFVIRETIASNGVDYLLFQSRIGEVQRLIIQRQETDPEFLRLVRSAEVVENLIVPKADDGTDPPPFSTVARNAALVCYFDDLLDDSRAATANLFDNVRVRAGTPPLAPFPARVLYDRNHGGVDAQNQFHPTRIVIDFTVSELESRDPSPFPLNPIGLPASDSAGTDANVSVRFPTELDFASGQFSRLQNLIGTPLSTTENGPVDLASPTQPVVRGMRSGNPSDINRGFLADTAPPKLLGEFPAIIGAALPEPGDTSGRIFLVDFQFLSTCATAPISGDVLTFGGGFVEVLEPGTGPDVSGHVSGVRVAASGDDTVAAALLLGPSTFVTLYRSSTALAPSCWVRFTPEPDVAPSSGVDPNSSVQVRLSEAMEVATLNVYDSLRVVEGPAGVEPTPRNIVPGAILQDASAAGLAFVPVLPFSHTQGVAERFHVEVISELTDLAGNAPVVLPAALDFTLDPEAPTQISRGVVLRFGSTDELEPLGADMRGQIFYDLVDERLFPRPVTRSEFSVDRSNPVPSLMIPFPPGLNAPLVPLGSKLQTLWRYADAGFQLLDESKHNLDVEGLHWAPLGGLVVADFYQEFEILLSHAGRLPDEDVDATLLPKVPASGLFGAPNPFAANVLSDPSSPQEVVHPRALGYVVDPLDLTSSSSGTLLMPYPLNALGTSNTFTWRDTAVLAEGGGDGLGVPMGIEVGPPLFLEEEEGSYAGAEQVPSIGLPLLMEFRTFPSNTAIGLNRFDVSLAINTSARPNFRAFSGGGIGVGGLPMTVDPDLEDVPSGGFNPFSTPPGLPTMSADNTFYLGQLSTVTKVSRAHSVWIDTQLASPMFTALLLDASEPHAARVVAHFRGADGFTSAAGGTPFDAGEMDPYGDIPTGDVLFHRGAKTWTADLSSLDGARYIQVRLSFTNDIETGATSTLRSMALVYQ